MARVQLDGLKKSYGATVAVERFDLEVADGELVALLGPSGCGKSTVLRMMAGITPPDDGAIRIAERRVDALVPEKRNIGLVFQSYALFPHMNVARNVGFGLRMRGVRRTEAARRVHDALALVELADLASRFPRELSGGQQQRVALARALVIEPDVLLLDEPLSNLDAKLREQLRGDIRALQKRLRLTAIYVTHDQAEAMALADRIVLMNNGKIVESGTPLELYRAPKTRFGAQFLGQTNLIEAVSDGRTIQLPWGERFAQAGAPGPVAVSIRPEDLGFAPAADGLAEVVSLEFLGAELEYRLAIKGQTLRARVSGAEAAMLDPGARVNVRLPPRLHVLAAEPQ